MRREVQEHQLELPIQRPHKAILVDRKVVPIHTDTKEELTKWAKWFEEKGNRRVKRTSVGDADISTVFLSINHAFMQEQPDLWFETMIFGGADEGYCERHSTWDQAVERHDAIVERLKAGEKLR